MVLKEQDNSRGGLSPLYVLGIPDCQAFHNSRDEGNQKGFPFHVWAIERSFLKMALS